MKELRDKYQVKVHIHVHETKKEIQDHVENPQFKGQRPLARLNDLGFCDSSLIAVHMNQLEDDEIDFLAKNKVNVVHCPESNLKLKSGVCPVIKLFQKNVNVAIGTGEKKKIKFFIFKSFLKIK